MKTQTKIAVLFFLFLKAGSGFAQGNGPRYYVTLFGWENWRNAPAFSHSFGQFTEVRAEGTSRTIEINFLPTDDHMVGRRPLRMPILGRHPQQNPDAASTIARGQAASGPFNRRDIYQYGPYEIRAELFEKAEKRYEDIVRGRFGYSFFHRGDLVCVSALIFDNSSTGVTRGPGATQAVLDSYVRNGWVLSATPPVERFPKLSGHQNGVKLAPGQTFTAPATVPPSIPLSRPPLLRLRR